jgi:hypothetical protein
MEKTEDVARPPFFPGEKVRCIKKDEWHLNAGRGERDTKGIPVYGEIYTVSFVGKPVSDVPNDDGNGVVWGMTLEEFPDDRDWDSSEGPMHIFSCRRFVKAGPL